MKTLYNYQSANEFLGKKVDRPFAHNTRIVRDNTDDSIRATYHGHSVVTFYPTCTVYSSCGWKTPTTKERLNWFLPEGFYIYQEKSIWHLRQRSYVDRNAVTHEEIGSWIFADGLVIDNYNRVSNAADESEVIKTQKLIKRIKKYVTDYINAFLNDKVEAPSGGDCWYCCMKTDDGRTMGELGNNQEHMLSHMDEKYYVPSLIVNAIDKYPICQAATWMFGIKWGGQSDQDSKWIRDIFVRDATKALTHYLKFAFGIAE